MLTAKTKELAEQAGIEFDAECVEGWIADDEHLERFAELIRADERSKVLKEIADAKSNETNY